MSNTNVKLSFTKPKTEVKEYDKLPLSIGRDPNCDIVLVGNRVSRRHAVIESKENKLILRNENSKNGILVNGSDYNGETIGPDNLIQIGEYSFYISNSKNTISNQEDNHHYSITICDEDPNEIPDIQNYKELIKALMSMHKNMHKENPIASCLKLLSEVLPINRIGVFYVDDNDQIEKGETLSQSEQIDIKMSQTFIKKVIESAKPILLTDVESLNQEDWGSTMQEENVSSILGCPIFTMEKVSAVILCENLSHDEILNESHLKVINLFGGLLNSIFQHEAMNKIDQQKKALEETNATKDKLFSVIAHDLKTPFNGLIGALSCICDEDIDENVFNETEKMAMLNSLLEQSKSTLSLIENLLLWAQSEKGEIKIFPENINLMNILKKCVSSLFKVAKNKNITIQLNVGDSDTMMIDEPSLRIILTNLINNAIKFTPMDGSITLNVTHDEKNSILEVADTGIGLDESLSEDLFNNHTHTSTYGTENEKGTGIGLGLCHELCKKNNGEIWYKNSPSQGCSFFISFPSGN